MKRSIRKTETAGVFDEQSLASLFWHLEEHPGTPQTKRVERILYLLTRLGDIRLGREEAVNVTAELRRRLHMYRWVNQVSKTPGGYRAILLIADRGNLSPDDLWEYGAVRDLLDITHYPGALSRLRRCGDDACKRWLFAANRNDQRFCDGNCRQHHYDSDEETRKKKREHMRKLYAEERDRNARNPQNGVGLRRHRKA